MMITTTTPITPSILPPNVNQDLVNILKLTKAHYAGDSVKKDLKKNLYIMKDSGDYSYGNYASAAAHHFTARGDINMHSELRDDNIWEKKKTFGLLTDFFKKHNKNKSKKRKASVMNDNNVSAAAAGAVAAAEYITPLRETTIRTYADRFVIPTLQNLTTAQ